MYWFAVQQQTSTLDGKKFSLFYLKFRAESNARSRNFSKQQEVAKKLLKLKQSGKTPTGVVRRLRLNCKVKLFQNVSF